MREHTRDGERTDAEAGKGYGTFARARPLEPRIFRLDGADSHCADSHCEAMVRVRSTS